MQENPLVTVYIPTYNRIEMLKKAVDSVLNQTYTNLEVIIVDDCSPDNTLEYLAEISKIDSRVRYFQNEKNSGACVSRNKAIKEAKGCFITGLDDDDCFLPERVEQFVKIWPEVKAKYPDMICLFSNVLVKHKDGKQKKYKKPKVVKQKDLLIANFIGNQVFTKTESLKAVMFDESLPMWQDLDCWYRILKNGFLACNVNNTSYYLDTSHLFFRLSEKKITLVKRTFVYFCKKNSLSKKERIMLKAHINNYLCPKFSVFEFIKITLGSFSIKSSYYLFKKFLICKI
jgi:glycosyltransferase involved in cell wall biosynthesis